MTGFETVGTADLAVAGVLFVLLPALSLIQARHLTPELIQELRRVPAYASSVAALLVVGFAALWVGTRVGRTPAALFLSLPGAEGAPSVAGVVGWTVLVLGATVAVVLAFRWLGTRLGAREHPVLRALLPRTASERRAFVALSLTAGVAEEVAYRGYAIALLLPFLGAAGSVAASSVLFGALHAYQGVLGMARTTGVGVVMAVGLLASGSLWPCILAHAAYDVVAGTILAERLMVPGADSRV